MSAFILRRPVFPLLLASVIVAALTAIYTAYHLQTHNSEDLRIASEGLLQGKTHWITFQNRVLGPLLIAGLRAITGWSWLRCFYGLSAGCMFTGGLLLVWQARKESGAVSVGLGFSAGWFLLAFVFNHAWSYPWDFLGALLNLVLVIWAQNSFRTLADLKSWPLAAGLLGLMLNRESSLLVFCALFFTVIFASRSAPAQPRALRWLIPISAAALVNVALVLLLRRFLFVQSTRPANIVTTNETAAGNFLQLADNWRLLSTSWENPVVRGLAWAMLALVGALAVCSLWTLGRAVIRRSHLAPGEIFSHLYLCFATVAIVVFADLSEARVYFELIPFLIILIPGFVRQPASVRASL